MSMPIIIGLFVMSIILLGLGLAWGLSVAKESDEQAGESHFTKNQLRAMAWVAVILIALIAALIEYFIVVR